MPVKPAASTGEKSIGKVEHYYPKAKAAAVGLSGDLKVGDEIHIVGHGDDVRKKVTSLQIDREPIEVAHEGDHVGVGLASKVHEGDDVLLVTGANAKPRKAASKPKGRKASRQTRKPKRAKSAKKTTRRPRQAKTTRRKAPARRSKTAKQARPKAARRQAKRGTAKGAKSRRR